MNKDHLHVPLGEPEEPSHGRIPLSPWESPYPPNPLFAAMPALEIPGLDRASKLAESNRMLVQAIEELKQAQEQLIQSEKMATLGRLVAGVSHEINTPLGVCLTTVTFQLEQLRLFEENYESGSLQRKELEYYLRSLRESADLILKNLSRANDLTRGFKSVSADQVSDEIRTLCLRQYTEELLLTLRPKLKGTGVHLSLECPSSLKVTTYPGVIYQIVSNLFINALVHGFPNGREGRLLIAIKDAEPSVLLTVEDDGAGIDPQNLPRVFEPFFTTNRQGGNTGLGLSIVYNLVTQKLRGTVKCESTPGKLTRFTLRFPKNLHGQKEERPSPSIE